MFLIFSDEEGGGDFYVRAIPVVTDGFPGACM